MIKGENYIIKRVKRKGKLYIYAFEKGTGRIITYKRWSSNRTKRERAYKEVEEIAKERTGVQVVDAIGVKAYYSSLRRKKKAYKGVTTKFEFLATKTIKGGEVTGYTTDKDRYYEIKEEFANGLHEAILDFWASIGFSPTSPVTDIDFFAYEEKKRWYIDNETLQDDGETQYFIRWYLENGVIILEDYYYPLEAISGIKSFLSRFAGQHNIRIRAFGRWYG